MKILVCGSREWHDYFAIKRRFQELPKKTTIISGAARGVDQAAARIGAAMGFKIDEFPAEWTVAGIYRPGAGRERNILMLEQEPDLVIAFWDGESKGTAHTIREAKKRGIQVEIIKPK